MAYSKGLLVAADEAGVTWRSTNGTSWKEGGTVGTAERGEQRILVTGGSGFVGVNLIHAFLARGYERITALDIAPFDLPERARIRTVRADVRDRAAVAAAMRGADWVVHAAAALPGRSRREVVSTNVVGTRVVLEAAHREQVDRFIFLSSAQVYGACATSAVTEESGLVRPGPFVAGKVRAEQLCEDTRRRGTCVTVLRPQCCVGPQRLGEFELLFSLAADGHRIPVIGPGEYRWQLTDVDDLCDAILLCLTADRARANDTFNIGAERFGTVRDELQALLDEAGHGRSVASLPLRGSALCLRALWGLGLSPLHPSTYTEAGQRHVLTEKLSRTLGFHPRFSTGEALLRNYEWYLQYRQEIAARSASVCGSGHRSPWRHGALDLVKILM